MPRVQLAVELVGYALLIAAAVLVSLPLGLAVAGVLAIWVGNATIGD